MNINENTNVKDVTLAEIHVALFEIEQSLIAALRKFDFKGVMDELDRYMRISSLASKRSAYVNKNGIRGTEIDDVQKEIAAEVMAIMDAKENSKTNGKKL